MLFPERGDLEVLDKALFLGLDTEEVPPGLSHRAVKWRQDCNPGQRASQEGLEAEARIRSWLSWSRDGPSCKGLRHHQPSPLQTRPAWDVTCCGSHSQAGAEKQQKGLCPPLSLAQLCYNTSHSSEKRHVAH